MKTLMNTLSIALCCAVMILAGCKADPTPLDPYLVGDENCSPPCWNGILPGKTSQDEAILIMRQINDENGGRLSVTNYGMSWCEKVSGKVYAVRFQDNLVKLIDFPLGGASLEQVIDLVGEPEYWISLPGRGAGGDIFMYYPEKGLAFTVILRNQKLITKDASVNYSYFVSSTDIRNEIGIIHGEGWINKFMSRTRKWNGYGEAIPQN